MSSAGRMNYFAENLEAAACVYDAGVNIGCVYNMYSGIPD